MEQARSYKIKLKKLSKAVSGLRHVIEVDISGYSNVIKDAIKNGRVQKFEYCVELLWKAIKIFLFLNEKVNVKSPKQTIKEFYNSGYINEDDYNTLIEMLDDRNNLSHVYNEKIFKDINKKFRRYLKVMIATTLILQEKRK